MALLAGCGLFLLEQVIPKITGRDKMLSIGRMDMNWNIDDVINHCKRLNLPYDPEIETLIRQKPKSVYTSKEFYQLLKFVEYDDIDFIADAGCTIVHDMNYPLPAAFAQQFDYVCEVGTIEHIFDQKTVLGNMASSVKVGGIVSHISPLEAYNHGFYNYSLNIFHDFYCANGFNEMEFFLLQSAKNFIANQNVIVHRFPYTPEEFHIGPEIRNSEYNTMGIGFIARKHQQVEDIQIPQQGSYDPDRKLTILRKWDK